jgi:hypothetical protein
MTPAEHWALLYYEDIGMPAHEAYPFEDEAAARACWRRNRARLMSEMRPGHPPSVLWTLEPESFVSVEAVRALRLDRESLNRGAVEFQSIADSHRRHGRPELAEEFEARAACVRSVIAEMEIPCNS